MKFNYRVTYVRGLNEGLTDQNPLCPVIHLSAVDNLSETFHKLGVDPHISS